MDFTLCYFHSNSLGNPITKTIPHYRRMVVSKCRCLTMLDGHEICAEERRRCNAWGAVVMNGGTFNAAQEADRRELIKILTEQSEKNADVRRMKALTRKLSDVPPVKSQPSKVSTVLSMFSPTALGLGNAIESKPTSSLVSTGLKKTLQYLNPTLRRTSRLVW